MNAEDDYGLDAEMASTWMESLIEGDFSDRDGPEEMVYDQTKRLMGTLVEFQELMMMYTCAMKKDSQDKI